MELGAAMIKPPELATKVPKIREVMADNFMRILIDGPEVSFNGSPTVSPTTAALCSSVGLPSIFFLKVNCWPFSS